MELSNTTKGNKLVPSDIYAVYVNVPQIPILSVHAVKLNVTAASPTV
jgi:hypothetical protein